MRLLICILMFCLWLPTVSAAREIRIRSGEHDGFSRLVIYTNARSTPSIDRLEKLLRFRTGDASDTFDTSGVFDFIPRSRIKSVSARDGGTLIVETDCQCEIATGVLSGGQFVIDVVDITDPQIAETPDNTAGKEASATVDAPRTRAARIGLPIASGYEMKPETDTPARKEKDEPDPALPVHAIQPLQTQALDEEKLLQQLARAASQGLLSPNVAGSSLPPITEIQTLTIREVEEPSVTTIQKPRDHLKVQTVMDRDMALHRTVGAPEFSEEICLPDTSFSIADWGEENNGHLDFSIGRSRLVTEVDDIDATALLQYLRHQIYLTLGAETIAQLSTYTGEFPERQNLTIIANVMANSVAPDTAHMSSQLQCTGPVALWAMLSIPRLLREVKPNTAAIITEFSALPRHLRAHLGPMLMRKYLSIGDTDTAMEINRITERGSKTTNSAIALSDANLSLATDKLDKATATLSEIVDSDDQYSVDAILLLVRSSIENQKGIPDRTFELLASLAHEHHSMRYGYRLALSEIDALTHAARFDGLVARLDALHEFPDLEQVDYTTRIANFGNALVQKASNAAFLRFALGNSFWTDAPEETRLAIADRLMDLGFANNARKILSTDAEPPSRAVRLMIARTALAEGEAKVALGYLAGLNTDTAQELRRATLSKINPENTAITLPEELDASSFEDPDAPPSLAVYRALIGKSEDLRTGINAKLTAVPSPLDGT